ncbi:unnamed protein product, partial [Brenthis ino]
MKASVASSNIHHLIAVICQCQTHSLSIVRRCVIAVIKIFDNLLESHDFRIVKILTIPKDVFVSSLHIRCKR